MSKSYGRQHLEAERAPRAQEELETSQEEILEARSLKAPRRSEWLAPAEEPCVQTGDVRRRAAACCAHAIQITPRVNRRGTRGIRIPIYQVEQAMKEKTIFALFGFSA